MADVGAESVDRTCPSGHQGRCGQESDPAGAHQQGQQREHLWIIALSVVRPRPAPLAIPRREIPVSSACSDARLGSDAHSDAGSRHPSSDSSRCRQAAHWLASSSAIEAHTPESSGISPGNMPSPRSPGRARHAEVGLRNSGVRPRRPEDVRFRSERDGVDRDAALLRQPQHIVVAEETRRVLSIRKDDDRLTPNVAGAALKLRHLFESEIRPAV